MKSLLAFLLLFFSFLSKTLAQSNPRPPKLTKLVQAVKLVKRGIVKVEVGGSGQLSSGSGFFVSQDGYVITNNHVVAPFYEWTNPTVQVGIILPTFSSVIKMVGSFNMISCQIIDRDIVNDLALLKLDPNPLKNYRNPIKVNGKTSEEPLLPKFSRRIVEDGEQIVMSGYPLNGTALITNVGYISSNDIADYNYEADMRVNHGNSGGPVYLAETGEIIGVAVGFTPTAVEYQLKDGRPVPKERLALPAMLNANQPQSFSNVSMSEVFPVYNSGVSRVISLHHVILLLKKHNIQLK